VRRHLLLFSVLVWSFAGWTANAATVYQLETVAGGGCPLGGGPAATAAIGTPSGIAVDVSGNIYFSDTDNHLLRKVSTNGTLATLAGTCIPGFSGDGGPAAAAQLNQPYGVAVDTAGNVYVADYGNNRVRRIGLDGTISTVAGNGQGALAGEDVPAVTAPLLTPRNVAFDAAGNLFISEFTGHRVRKMTPDGRIATVAGNGIAGYGGDTGPATAAQLNFPAGLAFDRAGALYIADSSNHRARKVSSGVITTVLGPTMALPGGGTTPLYGPTGLAVDSSGIVYIAEDIDSVAASIGVYNPATDKWSLAFIGPSGSVAASHDIALDVAGNCYLAAGKQVWLQPPPVTGGPAPKLLAGGGNGLGDGGSATAAQLSQPWGIALDSTGNLYIADTGNERIRKVNLAGQISTVAGDGTTGSSGDNGPAVAAQLWSPSGVVVDLFGNLYIADTLNERVRVVGVDGSIVTVLGNGQDGLGQQGLPGPQTALNNPEGLCVDQTGVLYAVDEGNNRVLRLPALGNVTTAAGNGSSGYGGDGGPAHLAKLKNPFGCSLDPAGDLFIADTGNNTVRKVSPDGNIETVAGTGAAGFSGDGGPATSATLNAPTAVLADGNGNLYISDMSNGRIRLVTPDGSIQTIAGGPAMPLNQPAGMALDGSGNLYIAELGSQLIRKLVAGTAADSSPQAAPATPSNSPISAVNAASLSVGAVAPGELITIFGAGLGPQTGVAASPDATGSIPASLGGTQIEFDGNAAPVLYTQASQVNVQVPYSVAGAASTSVAVLYNGQQVGAIVLPVAATAPAIFAPVVNPDGSVNSASQPAASNSIITFYATGEGLTTGANVTGAPAAAPYPQPVAPVSVTIAGLPAQILSAASAPGQVGTVQVTALTPGGFVPSGQAAVVLTVGAVSSPPAAIWLQ
jgi:trimeric autotransporter adhesin